MYIKIKDGVVTYPYNINLLYSENPNTSFPNTIQTDYELLNDFDVFKVIQSQKPQCDNISQKCVETEPEFENGFWRQRWTIESLSEEESTILRNCKEAEARAERHRLLTETDWTQYRDISESVSSKYIEYRQALRDISSQEGFPFDIIWPSVPE